MIREDLRKYLSEHPKRTLKDKNLVPAAVVLPLFIKINEWWILFIKRTETVKYHKGQVSFPGGRRERVDNTMRETALRELEEEIGVPPDKVEIIGELDDNFTLTSNYLVSTFVGIIPYPYDFKLDRREIAYVFEVPIAALLAEGCLQEEERYEDGKKYNGYSYRYEDKIIWGATARILKQFLEIWATLVKRQPR